MLHVFSGKVDLTAFPGDTVDVNPALNPTYVDDAQTLQTVPLEKHDLVLADLPYSVEDCYHYGTTMISGNKVMKALEHVRHGTHIVWLDQVLPMYRKDKFSLEAVRHSDLPAARRLTGSFIGWMRPSEAAAAVLGS